MENNNLKCRLLFLSIILIFILSIGAVCAAQDNTTAGSLDDNVLAIEKTNFNTNDGLGDAISMYGGAIYWNGNDDLLDNCTFEGNSITGSVGG